MFNFKTFILLFLAFAQYLPILSQDQYKLKEVIIKSQVDTSAIGSNNTNIGPEKLESYVSDNIAYALSSNTPVFVKQSGPGAVSSISIRSSLPSQTQIIWNHLKINSALYGMTDLSLIPIFFVNNIQVYEGPSSLNYGYGGLGGAVVIDSGQPVEKGLHIWYQQQFASFNTFGEFFNVSYKKKNLQTSIKIFSKYSKNDFFYKNRSILDESNEHPLSQNKNATYHIIGLMNDIAYAFNKFSNISNNIWLNSVGRYIPNNALIINQRDNNNFAHQKDLQLRNALNYRLYTKKAKFLSFIVYDYQTLDFYSQKYVYGAPLIVDINSYAHTNTAKVGMQIDDLQLNKNIYLYNSLSYTNNQGTNVNKLKGTSIRANIGELENLMKLRVRYNNKLSSLFILDNIYRSKYYFLYYAGFNYLLYPSYDLYLKISAGSQLRFPSINDLYFVPGGNPNLLPERNNTVQISSSLKVNDIGISIATYYSKTKNWILWLPKNAIYWTPMNVGRVESKGLELFLDYKKVIGPVVLKLSTSINYSHITDNYLRENPTDKQLPYMPKLASNFNVKFVYNDTFFQWLFTNYSKRYVSLDKNTSRDSLPAYFMNDIIVGHKVQVNKFNILIEIKVLNLFNESYYAVEYMPMPGRNYSFSITTCL